MLILVAMLVIMILNLVPAVTAVLLAGVSEETRLIVSEPLSDLPGVWNEIPESSCGVVQAGRDELRPFQPR